MADTLGGKFSNNVINAAETQKFIDVAPALTTLQILTNPPQAKVFLDEKPLGSSEANGWLVAEKISRGTHHLKVTSDGFIDSESEISCDGEVFQTVVQLRSLMATNVIETSKQGFTSAKNHQTAANAPDTMVNLTPIEVENNIALNADSTAPAGAQNVGIRSYPEPEFEKTNLVAKQNTLKGGNATIVEDSPIVQPEKSSFILPMAIGAAALILLFLGGVGFLAYRYFPIYPPGGNTNLVTPQTTPTAQPGFSPTPDQGVPPVKGEMVKIEGGTFQMGRNDGQTEARPAHPVTVKSFIMDKTEVTVDEYAEFVAATGHRAPKDWNGAKPSTEILNLPVGNVSLDDARTFAKWRSGRDEVEYRLPTEAEWEFAARNGADATLYPWGNKLESIENLAVVNASSPMAVGSMPKGANKWGVLDLIGNVWEWTDSEFAPYPGSNAILKSPVTEYVFRGGGNAIQLRGNKLLYITSDDRDGKPVDSTFRNFREQKVTNFGLGFRLVRDIKTVRDMKN